MRRVILSLSVVAASGLAVGANGAPARSQVALLSAPVTAMTSPAPDGAAEPRLHVDAGGRVRLSWLAPRAGGGHAFQFSELRQGQWAKPVTIAEGTGLIANWADFPALFVTKGGLMAAHWLERGQTRAAYDVKLRTSTDGGRTWTDAVTPHRDGTATEHGFVSFFDAPGTGANAGLGLVWLDGREMAGHGGHGAGGQMTLRSAMVTSKGQAGEEMLVDDRVCDCCQTAATATDSGVLVAYRDRTDAEIRDIVVTRLENGKWSAPAPVHADRWEINGCPVNGPAIDARGAAVAVAWYTAVGNAPKTLMVFSTDGGRTFGAPVRIDSGTTLGRVGVSVLSAGRALVSWIDSTGANAQFMVRAVTAGGPAGAPVAISPMSGDRTSGFPQIAVSGRTVVAAWTHVQRNAPTKVSVATATLAR